MLCRNAISQDVSAVKTTIRQEKEYLIYMVSVLDANNNIHKLIVYWKQTVINQTDIKYGYKYA
jgi:hypothetical protein